MITEPSLYNHGGPCQVLRDSMRVTMHSVFPSGKVFVVHWTPQATRRQQMHQQLEAIGFKGTGHLLFWGANTMSIALPVGVVGYIGRGIVS